MYREGINNLRDKYDCSFLAVRGHSSSFCLSKWTLSDSGSPGKEDFPSQVLLACSSCCQYTKQCEFSCDCVTNKNDA